MANAGSTHKHCKRCSDYLPVARFDSNGRGRYTSNCKLCRSVVAKSRRLSDLPSHLKKEAQQRVVHKQHILEYSRKYYSENTDKVRAQHKRWRARHPGCWSVYTAKRRATLAGLPGSHSEEDVLFLLDLCDGKCLDCGNTKRLEVDHVIPITSPESNNSVLNLQILCRRCNQRKFTNSTDYRNPKQLETIRRRVYGTFGLE